LGTPTLPCFFEKACSFLPLCQIRRHFSPFLPLFFSRLAIWKQVCVSLYSSYVFDPLLAFSIGFFAVKSPPFLECDVRPLPSSENKIPFSLHPHTVVDVFLCRRSTLFFFSPFGLAHLAPLIPLEIQGGAFLPFRVAYLSSSSGRHADERAVFFLPSSHGICALLRRRLCQRPHADPLRALGYAL